jgi:pimeloyl-ACP methyl ester carboxylesterase
MNYLARMPGYFAIPPDFSYKQHNRGGFVAVNGINLHYERYGEGEALLLLHGNAQSLDFLCLQIPFFAQQYQVIAVDTRGHGQSGTGDAPYSFEWLAADMDALLQHLGIDSAYIVGWSDGGTTGLVMAMQYPQRVKKLITMGSHIFMDETVVDAALIAEAQQMAQSLAADPTPENNSIAKMVDLLLHHPQYRFDDLRQIACPVLVMAGETDIIKTEHTRQIAAHIPQGHLLIAQGETHHYPVRNPAVFNQTVLAFLKT